MTYVQMPIFMPSNSNMSLEDWCYASGVAILICIVIGLLMKHFMERFLL